MKAISEKPGEKILFYYMRDKEEGITELTHCISSEWVVPVFITKKEKNELKVHPPDSITIHGELTKLNLVSVLKEAQDIFSNRNAKPVVTIKTSFLNSGNRDFRMVGETGNPSLIQKFLDESVCIKNKGDRGCDGTFNNGITHPMFITVVNLKKAHPKADYLHLIGQSILINEREIIPGWEFNSKIILLNHGIKILIPDKIGRIITAYQIMDWKHYESHFAVQSISNQLRFGF